MPPVSSTLRLVALMVFIALVAVAVWLADLRLAVALPLVGLAWAIAALIEWLAWRSARGYGLYVPGPAPAAAPPPPPVAREPVPAGPEPPAAPPLPDWAPLEHAAPEPAPPPPPVVEPTASTEPEAEPEAPPVLPEAEEEPKPAPVIELEPKPEPEPPDEEVTVVDPPRAAGEPEKASSWARRMRLRAVPPPPAEPPAQPPVLPAPPPESRVVSLPQRSYEPRNWNLWDLERLARADAQRHPEQREEWAFLFVHLRQFATADGELPREFDSLVRESFGGLLERQPSG